MEFPNPNRANSLFLIYLLNFRAENIPVGLGLIGLPCILANG